MGVYGIRHGVRHILYVLHYPCIKDGVCFQIYGYLLVRGDRVVYIVILFADRLLIAGTIIDKLLLKFVVCYLLAEGGVGIID